MRRALTWLLLFFLLAVVLRPDAVLPEMLLSEIQLERGAKPVYRFGEEVYALSHYQAQTGRVGPPPTQAEIKAKLAAKAKAESKAAPPTPTPTPPPPLPPPPPPRGAIVASGQGGRRGGRPPSRCDVQKATAFRAKYWAKSSVTFLNPDERLAHPQLEHRAHYRRRCR